MTSIRPLRVSGIAPLAVLAVAVLTSASTAIAQSARFYDGPLRTAAACIGGFWVAQEAQHDAQGAAFIPIRSCEWTAGGIALSFRQDLLYENGAIRPNLRGLTVWDWSLDTARVFGVFTNGGIVRDATYAPEAASPSRQVMEFTFVAAGSGTTTQWRSVEIHLDENTFTEEGLMLVDGEWRRMSFLTFHRLAEIHGAGTFHALTGNSPSETTSRPNDTNR